MAELMVLSLFESPSSVETPTPGVTAWLARDPEMQRPVLIKRLTGLAAKSRATEAITLDHPGIVKTRRWMIDENQLYVIRDVARGKNLRQRLAALGARPDTEKLRAILLPLLDALEYAHGHRLAHGGISYENILITDEGTVLLTDFGTTDASAPQHKPLYNGNATPENDIRALGKMMAALLPTTGPFSNPVIRSRIEGVCLRCDTIASLREVLLTLEKLATAPVPKAAAMTLPNKDAQTGVAPMPTHIAPAVTITTGSAPTRGVPKLLCSQPEKPRIPQGGGGMVVLEAKNDGDATLIIRMIATQHAWLNVRPINLPIVLPPGSSTKVGFVVSAARLASGEYRSEVYLSSNAWGQNAEDLRTGWFKHAFEVRVVVGSGGGLGSQLRSF
jgi:serine/threonine protein kinase